MAKIIEQVGILKTHKSVGDEELKEIFEKVGLISAVELMSSYKNWRLEFGFSEKGQVVKIFADMSLDATNINVGYYGGIIANTIYDKL